MSQDDAYFHIHQNDPLGTSVQWGSRGGPRARRFRRTDGFGEAHEVLVDIKMRSSNNIPLAKRGQAPQ